MAHESCRWCHRVIAKVALTPRCHGYRSYISSVITENINRDDRGFHFLRWPWLNRPMNLINGVQNQLPALKPTDVIKWIKLTFCRCFRWRQRQRRRWWWWEQRQLPELVAARFFVYDSISRREQRRRSIALLGWGSEFGGGAVEGRSRPGLAWIRLRNGQLSAGLHWKHQKWQSKSPGQTIKNWELLKWLPVPRLLSDSYGACVILLARFIINSYDFEFFRDSAVVLVI